MGKQSVTQPAALRKIDPIYTTLPLQICLVPPIAHRGGKGEGGLEPFDLAVLAGTLALARLTLLGQRFKHAFDAGGREIRVELSLDQQFKQEWRDHNKARRQGEPSSAPERYHTFRLEHPSHKPAKPLPAAVRRAGSTGFDNDLQQQRRGPLPDVIAVTVSQNNLLQVAGLRKSGPTRRRLLAALDRLQRPIGGEQSYPRTPLLRKLGRTKDGRLHLAVNGEWLEPPFRQVPLPLPMRGATIQALYLFLFAIQPWLLVRQRDKAIHFHALCERLGMPLRDSFHAGRGINRALYGVNQHLASLDLRALCALKREDVDVPCEIKLTNAEYGRVRFTAQLPNLPDEDEIEIDSIDRPTAHKPKPKVAAKPVVIRRRLPSSVAAAVTESPPIVERKRLPSMPMTVSPILQEVREEQTRFSAQGVWEQTKLSAVQQAWRELVANPTAESKRDFRQFLDRNHIGPDMLRQAVAEATGVKPA